MFTKYFKKGIHFLERQQQEDGSFLSSLSTQSENFNGSSSLPVTFETSLILLCISTFEMPSIVEKIKKECVKFLLSQKSELWSVNYWSRYAEEAKQRPYPDDLDDTFCALAGIFSYNQSLIDGAAMAKIVTLLTTLEEHEGGPYYTWLVPKTADTTWKDIDIAVNSNIAFFLSLQKVSLPNLFTFIEAEITKGKLISPYYPSSYPVIYFISRFYHGSKKDELVKLLLAKRKKDMTWGNPLNTALAISSLLNFGVAPKMLTRSVKALVKQQHNGAWQPFAFWIDHIDGKETGYAGSSALTTACCLEALQKYHHAHTAIQLQTAQKKQVKEKERIFRQIVKKTEHIFSHLNRELKTEALLQLHLLLSNDKAQQIPLLPYYFQLSIGPLSRKIQNQIIVNLGVASILGWLAYKIYDNFLDEEGDPKTLSIANIALRELTVIFRNIVPDQSGFREFFQKVMDDLDSANAWEVRHCRIKVANRKLLLKDYLIPDYGNYGKIALKSLGHALGPSALLFLLGFTKDSPEVKKLIGFFKHYLIARQLNDDAHDWERDIRIGQINPVCAILLKKWEKSSGYTKTDISLAMLIPRLQELFWYESVYEISETIFHHINSARKNLHALDIIKYPEVFEKLLIPLETSAKQAIHQSKNAADFLQTYKS
jgi:hypothetical protein